MRAPAADDEVAVPHAARGGNPQPDRGARVAAGALMDAAVAYRHVVNVDDDLWRHDQHDVAVADRDLEHSP